MNLRFTNYLLLSFLLFICTGLNFAQVTPGDPLAVPIEFRFTWDLSPTDSGIGVNGSMNGWLNGVYKMKEVEPNLWKVTLELQPGSYTYKIVKYIDTVGQSGVTGYFTDPLNSNFGGPFNDSYMDVTDPMIYYLLPKNGSVTSNTKPVFMANFAVANQSQLDVDKIEFTLDGTAVPNAKDYYDAASKIFTYNLTDELLPGTHTATVKIYNTAGNSNEQTTTFSIASGISTAPYTFVFDSKSPSFNFQSEVKNVGLKATFNTEGLDEMVDSNGVYSVTKDLMVGQEEQYTYIVNGGSYINDPDNPNLSSRHRTTITKTLDPRSRYKNFTPASGMSYTSPLSSIEIKAYLHPSDSAYAINQSGIFLKYDGSILRPTKTAIGNMVEVKAKVMNPAEGRHVVEWNGKDDHGNNSWTSYYTFGIYPANSGFHYPDGENDDKGTGTYTYPYGITANCADIRELNIQANSTLDSLIIIIKMELITKNTRIGFGLVNKLSGEYVEAPDAVELRIPEWNGYGVFAIIAPPNSDYLNPATENILYTMRDPLASAMYISPDEASIANNEFRFAIPLNLLETVLGTYKNEWYFGAYSYLKNQDGTIEAAAANGASDIEEDPDVYDVTFFSDTRFQERLLSNYSSADQTGGPRIAVIGSEERGYGAVLPTDINSGLGSAPQIKLYASGGDLLYQPVKVKGFADVPSGTDVYVYCGWWGENVKVNDQHEFEVMVPLAEGSNLVYATVGYGDGLISKSSQVIYNYIVDHAPVAKIYSNISGSSIELRGDSSYSLDGTSLMFNWYQDSDNPEQIKFTNNIGTPTSFPKPAKAGEYYFTLRVKDGDGDTAWARTVIQIKDGNATSPDFSTWHPAWADSAVFYCIFVRTFDASGTFRGITERMQEIKDLGVNGIWLLPVHPSTGNMGPDNPGYAITNYLDILSDYGTKEDFREFVNEAHKYGIRVIMDHVIQHTSDLHPFMKDANLYKEASPYYPFYYWDANENFQYLFTWVDLPSINYSQQTTRDYLVRMAKYWMQEFKIDGYRCDVAWAIDSLREEGPAYWQRWRSDLKNMKPDIFLLAEGDAWQTKLFNKKFDAAYDWKWFGAIKGVVTETQSIDNLNKWITSYYSSGFPQNALTFKFLENQDEERFIKAYGIGSTQVSAIQLLTTPGVPMLYAGQEVGETTNRGNIDWSDPYSLRPFYKALIDIRKNNPALAYGDFTRLTNGASDKIYSYLRTEGNSNVIVNLNFSESTVNTNISVPMNKISYDSNATFYLVDHLNTTSWEVKGTDLKNYAVSLPPNSGQILILSDEPLTDVEKDKKYIPVQFNLAQNYPNPFNPSTTIKYSLPSAAHVKITVYNVVGQKVDELINKDVSAGYHNVIWNAGNYASGIYIYNIEAISLTGGKNFNSVRKMVLVK
ncbi:MAG: T9SS C-terminal target domain-containing protein [Ignavibacteriales bacterium]|nr:MAG: T9SS C-terminal target domain-containing protein [Ignavibacteriales bacterium]